MCSYIHETMQFFDKFETDSSSKGMDQMKCKMKEEEETRMEENYFKKENSFSSGNLQLLSVILA